MNRWSFESPTTDEVTQLSLSSNALGEINTLVVTNVGSLPDLAVWTSPDSVLVFVQNLGVYAISSQLRWITLDGRLLRDDAPGPGQAWTWGVGNSGRLGDNTTVAKSSPVSVVGGFTDWCASSASSDHTVALRTGGSAWGWGAGGNGRLGDNTTVDKSSPVSVVGGFTDWYKVSANGHSTGLRTNRSAWAWGINSNGQLGDGTTTARSSPVSVIGGFTDWSDIAAGGLHTLAVRTNGTAWSWGCNYCGSLGINSITNRSSPVSVVGGFTDWCQVSAGARHSAAVRSSGSLWVWGNNYCGRLGDNTSINRSSPVSVVGGITDWCKVSAGNQHTMAIRLSGSAWGMGYGRFGRLGNNDANTNRSSPASVVGGFTDWCQVSAGAFHSTAVRTGGSAWAWGANTGVGDNTTVDRSSPVSIVGGFNDWFSVVAGNQFSIGLRGPV